MASQYPQWVITGGAQARYGWGVYGYMPVYGLAWAAAAAFGVVGLVSLVITVAKTPKCWWMYLLPLTCFMEVAGYALRVYNMEVMTLGTVIGTIVLPLIPPIIGAVLLYEMMGYLLMRAKMNLFCLKPKWVAWAFLTGDVLSFVIQCGAAGLLTSKDPNAQDTGSKIVLTGLVMQFIIFLFFAYSAIYMIRLPVFAVTVDPVTKQVKELVPRTKLIFGTMLTVVSLLLLRNSWRMYEYGNAYALKKAGKMKNAQEWEHYVFDAIPVWICCVLLTVVHFGVLIKNAEEQRKKQEAAAATAALVDGGAVSPQTGVQMVAVGSGAADKSSAIASLDYAKSSKLPPVHPTSPSSVAAPAGPSSSPSHSSTLPSSVEVSVAVKQPEAEEEPTAPGN
jgi:RTA1 like protein